MKTKTKSNNFDVVWYHGYEFPVRFVKANIFPYNEDTHGKRMIATEEFEDNYLLNKYDCSQFADEEAKKLDEQIFCYVPEEVLKTYSDEEFDRYIVDNFG